MSDIVSSIPSEAGSCPRGEEEADAGVAVGSPQEASRLQEDHRSCQRTVIRDAPLVIADGGA